IALMPVIRSRMTGLGAHPPAKRPAASPSKHRENGMEWRFELLNKPLGRMTEGPVWDGEVLRFTHLPTSCILQYDPRSGDFSEWRNGVNRVNGLAYDANGQLFGCCSGGRSIVRFDADGTNVVVADRLDGNRLNTPNDLAIDVHGRIWFSNAWSAKN